MLKFSKANAKIAALENVKGIIPFLNNNRKVYSLDLLSGFACPFASKCLSRAIVEEGKPRRIQDGPNTEFRCFSASQEVIFPKVYELRKHNFDMLRNCANQAQLIADSMPENLGVCRLAVGGDFFNEQYFLAWLDIAKQFPDRLFYAYTKSLPYWIKNRKQVEKLDNFVLTASYGGRCDDMIKEHKLRWSKVVLSIKSAGRLPLDTDDSHAADPSKRNKNFALLIHGIQPKGTKANDAIQQMKRDGVDFHYHRKKKKCKSEEQFYVYF